MYHWLCRYLPPRWAAGWTTTCYVVLILLVILAWRGNEEFRYGRM